MLYKRENYLKKIRSFFHDTDIIKVITGVRGCGKTSIMKMIKDELIEQGVDEEKCLFIDLESKIYRKVKTDDDLENLIDSYSYIKDTKYLFIDEIQNINNFEELINAYRNDGGFSIFITGSYLLNEKHITKLTGRYIEFEIFPLNFEEYINMKRFFKKDINPNLMIEFNNYIIEGGFPSTIFYDNLNDKKNYVSSLITEIFEKDIKRRVKINNIELYNMVKNFVINNFGQTISILSLQKALENAEIKVRRETLTRYIDILVSSKILYECNRFDMKSKKSLKGEKKYYLADLSIYFTNNVDNRINYEKVLENIIYLYAKSLDYSVSNGRIGLLEFDFILKDMFLNYSYVQVSYTINDSKKTEDREFAPLEKISDNYPKYVLTTDYLLQKRNGIKHNNIIDFITNKEKF